MATDYLIGNVKGPKGDTGSTGTAATIQVGTVSTLTPGSNATVTNAGTSSAAVFNFGIPQGAKGDKGNKGDTGAGVPTGGTTGQVLKKKSGTNYDTEWGTDSGGHTILNSSGTAQTQRSKLQFNGATVTDDSANDKTIVTTSYYKEGSTTVSTANQAFTVAISDSNISTSSKILSVCTSVKGLNYTDITLASGSCTISFPGVSSAQTVTVGIEWR